MNRRRDKDYKKNKKKRHKNTNVEQIRQASTHNRRHDILFGRTDWQLNYTRKNILSCVSERGIRIHTISVIDALTNCNSKLIN